MVTNKPKVLVSRRWPAAVEARLADRFDAVFNDADRALKPNEFRDALSEFDAVLPTVTDNLGAASLDVAAPRTRILANFGVGFSHIDIDRARARGIRVTNTPDVLSECTADLALTLMMMTARRAAEGERQVRAREWEGWRPTHMLGTKVSGKTLGIIGFGRIGQEVAKRAHFGFGMNIVVHNRSEVPASVLAQTGARQARDIHEVLPEADFVSLHCPGGGANRHLIDARRLSLMKPDAFLINTARGEVVDEHALIQALWFETIGGAGLDVYDGEPHIADGLFACPNAVLLPHLGSATKETREAMGFRVVENLVDFFEGKEPRDLVA